MQKFFAKWLPWQIDKRGVLIESLLFLGAYVVWLLIRPAQSPARWFIGSLAVLSPAAAAAILIFRSLAQLPAQSRRAWQFLGIGLAWWTLGMTVRTFANLIWVNQPVPLLVLESINFPVYPVLFCSLLFHPFEHRYSPSRFRFLLDSLVSSGVVAMLCYLSMAQPTNQMSTYQLLLLLYPIGDLILLMILINMWLANVKARETLLLWGLGLGAFLISDYMYSLLMPVGAYQPGGAASLGWTCGGLIFGAGAVITTGFRGLPDNNKTKPPFDLGTRLQNVLPISLVLVLGWFVLDHWRLSGTLSVPGVWASGVLTLGLIARMGAQAAEVELHRYRQLFDSLAEPAFICDADGKILLGNPALATALGLNEERQVLGRFLPSIFQGIEDPIGTLQTASRQSYSLEVNLALKGTAYLLSLSPIEAESRKTYIAGTAYDLSSQKHQQTMVQNAFNELQGMHRKLAEMNIVLEQRVEERTHTLEEANLRLEDQNRMLQALDQLKSDFVSMVSHELRTPLTSLNGGFELMLNRPVRRKSDRVTLELMKSEVQRLTRFVENVLNLSAVEAGRINVHLAPVSLVETIEEVQRQFSVTPGAELIRINVAEGLPPVRADEALLESVLTHLLDNALKYAPGSPVVVDGFEDHGRIRVQVTDAGPGIPEEKRPLLFQRFQRLDARDSQTVYGYGLGLYFCQQVLQALKSELAFEPSPGGGARFFFTLKAA